MTLGNVRDEIYGTKKTMKDEWFIDNDIIPLGTKRLYTDYKDGNIPDDEIVYLKVDKSNVQNILTVAPTGIGKSRFRKRIIGYQQRFGYNILAIDPKSYEYLTGGIKKGNGRRLHPFEENTTYKVKSYVPSFVQKNIFVKPSLKKKFHVYSPNIKSFTDMALWRNLGAADKGANFIVSVISSGIIDMDKIIKEIMITPLLMANTKKACIGTISVLQELGYFSSKYKPLDLQKDWDEGFIVAVSYFAQEGKFMNVDIAHIVQQIRNIGNRQLQNEEYITPKIIDFDDTIYYLERRRMDEFNMAIREIKNAQNNYRSLGINTNVTIQNPSFIDSKIIDGCTTKFIWGLENPDSLQGLIPQGAYELIRDRQLYEDEDTYTFECILVRGRKKWETFFPFDVQYGHGLVS